MNPQEINPHCEESRIARGLFFGIVYSAAIWGVAILLFVVLMVVI